MVVEKNKITMEKGESLFLKENRFTASKPIIIMVENIRPSKDGKLVVDSIVEVKEEVKEEKKEKKEFSIEEFLMYANNRDIESIVKEFNDETEYQAIITGHSEENFEMESCGCCWYYETIHHLEIEKTSYSIKEICMTHMGCTDIEYEVVS